MFNRKYLSLFALLFAFLHSSAITYEFSERLKWAPVESLTIDTTVTLQRLVFDGAYYRGDESLPRYMVDYPVHTASAKVDARLVDIVSVPVDPQEEQVLLDAQFADTAFFLSASLVVERKQPLVVLELIPVRWNPQTGHFEKILSFDFVVDVEDLPEPERQTGGVSNSVLSSGRWFKIKIDKTGIFKVTYAELQAMGFDINVDPAKIAVFGNGGGILPEVNTDFRHDDLVENPIVVVGEADGSFDPGDYILFFGQGPVVWKYNESKQRFYHQNNYYDDFAYYFITTLNGDGRRISLLEQPAGTVDEEITEFNDFAFHELDEVNIAGTGREWYGEAFDFANTVELTFDFPNLVTQTSGATYTGNFGAKAYNPSSFYIYIDGVLQQTVSMPQISVSNRYQIAQKRSVEFTFTPKSDQLTVKLVYQKTSGNDVGYLDYIDLNVSRSLVMTGGQMAFQKVTDFQPGKLVRYRLSGAGSDVTVWEVSDPVNPVEVKTTLSGGSLLFEAEADTLRRYIAFDGSEFYQASFVEEVVNQNLHAVKNIDYLIVTHPDFLTEAQRLAEFHKQHDGFDYAIATVQQIYNEYSSGAQDVTAIRDFIKDIYDKSDPGKELKYVLLFGDASYDYKDRTPDNSNFVPCWESQESLNIVNSIASDDYFGFLDDGEGTGDLDRVDIGIGRFVVATAEEATMAVDKCIHYATNTDQVMNPWRNVITFLADDEDANRHLRDAETLANFLRETYPVYNLDKIYVDAYEQVSTPSGQRAPAVNQAVNDRIEKGTMIFNYSGHGGETGLGHEQFLTIGDITSWTNYNSLSVFITATCEFSRYDDPRRVSAGELVFLNSEGGGIALFSTSRATYASANLTLNKAIYEDNMFKKEGGEYPRLGDIIRRSKTRGGANEKKFLLLGDPALQMAYPKLTAKTLKINSKLLSQNEIDTLTALSMVKIEGEVVDADGQLVGDFNGTLFPVIYDKATMVQTLKTDPGSIQTEFSLFKSVLFNGKTSIENGHFSFEFMMPKDIAYNYGSGRISYYLKDEQTDGHGYTEEFIIGGVNQDAEEDNNGPLITLFMNDTTFVPGGRTDQNPVLLAFVEDESGINTTGNGIGHDITAVIDDDQQQTYNLNTYYESAENRFNAGVITYPFKDLSVGEHVLSLKVWDVYNNSSVAFLNFLVTPNEELVIEHLLNYPNPFFSETYFVFNHNQSGQELQVTIEVYNSSGMLIRTLQGHFTSEGYKSVPLRWDGRTDNGGQIGRGFYIYRLIVRKEDGTTAEARSKLVYIKN